MLHSISEFYFAHKVDVDFFLYAFVIFMAGIGFPYLITLWAIKHRRN